ELVTNPRLMAGPYRTEIEPGLYAWVRVDDAGEGVSAEEIDRIFDPYFSRKMFGRGLGLAAVLGILHGHEGGVQFLSRPGEGSSVVLYFPLESRSAEA